VAIEPREQAAAAEVGDVDAGVHDRDRDPQAVHAPAGEPPDAEEVAYVAVVAERRVTAAGRHRLDLRVCEDHLSVVLGLETLVKLLQL
jgi:hypothetical protein